MSGGIQCNFLARERWIGAIGAFPEFVAENYSAIAARAVFWREQSASGGHDGRCGEDLGRDHGGACALWIADACARSGVAPREPHDNIGEGGSTIALPIPK